MLADTLQQGAVLLSGGIGVYLGTEGVKRLKAIPINPGQSLRLRATAGLFSAVATVLGGMADGNLMPQNLQDVGVAVLVFASTWLSAEAIHQVAKTRPIE